MLWPTRSRMSSFRLLLIPAMLADLLTLALTIAVRSRRATLLRSCSQDGGGYHCMGTQRDKYVDPAWNNLGNATVTTPTLATWRSLPPYNTLVAQVVQGRRPARRS